MGSKIEILTISDGSADKEDDIAFIKFRAARRIDSVLFDLGEAYLHEQSPQLMLEEADEPQTWIVSWSANSDVNFEALELIFWWFNTVLYDANALAKVFAPSEEDVINPDWITGSTRTRSVENLNDAIAIRHGGRVKRKNPAHDTIPTEFMAGLLALNQIDPAFCVLTFEKGWQGNTSVVLGVTRVVRDHIMKTVKGSLVGIKMDVEELADSELSALASMKRIKLPSRTPFVTAHALRFIWSKTRDPEKAMSALFRWLTVVFVKYRRDYPVDVPEFVTSSIAKRGPSEEEV